LPARNEGSSLSSARDTVKPGRHSPSLTSSSDSRDQLLTSLSAIPIEMVFTKSQALVDQLERTARTGVSSLLYEFVVFDLIRVKSMY